MTQSADQEGPQAAWPDLLVVTDEVEEAVLDCLVPGLVTKHRQPLKQGLEVVPVPGGGVLGNGLEKKILDHSLRCHCNLP